MKRTPRLQVPVSPETHESLRYCSEVTGRSIAAIAAELIQQTAPVMVEMTNALQVAKEAPAAAMRQTLEALDKAMVDANQLKLKLSDDVDHGPLKGKAKKKTA